MFWYGQVLDQNLGVLGWPLAMDDSVPPVGKIKRPLLRERWQMEGRSPHEF
tara:strand:- start:25151 stop:25303 length:153 start_codon:yes stop_codon:yes gene_type:complete